MLFNKKLINIILNIALLLLTIFIIYNLFYLYKENIKQSKEPFDFYTCTMNLKDIDPMFVDEYMKYDNRHVACGPCKNSTLKINVIPCSTNDIGTPSNDCKQNANIISSLGNPITYPSFINPENIKNFFCLD